MPELPEVESLKRSLEAILPGRIIREVEVTWPAIVQMELAAFQEVLRGQTLESLGRRGKYFIMHLTQGDLVVHFRMEGKFFFYPKDQLPEDRSKHVHVVFYFKDGSQLLYDDVRKFGRIQYLPKGELATYFDQKKLGPEPRPETFKLAPFQAYLDRHQKPIKAALLDQEAVVGLGNIYVDEVLFQAGIHPLTPSKHLQGEITEKLRLAIIDVLDRASQAGGSRVRTYGNQFGPPATFQKAHKVYGRKGQACFQCGQKIQKIKVAQRGTHFCPHCQHLL